MSRQRTKVSHPADLNNTLDKNIMSANEDKLSEIPDNIQRLTEYLNIDPGYCTYCTQHLDRITIDEIIPCMYGGRYRDEGPLHINMTESCNTCNRSKNNIIGDNFKRWINEGPNSGNNRGISYIPSENRTRLIEWYDRNTVYLRTDNSVILSRIKESHDIVKEFFDSRKDWARTPIL